MDLIALEKGDIVQIVDEAHHWYPALIIVDEVKSWGIQGYALVPTSNAPGSKAGSAYNRLNYSQIAKVGEAIVIAS